MRAWITVVLCLAALTIALTGILAGQDQQGPIRDNSGTVAKKKSTAPETPPDGDLPKIPSAYKKDKMDLGNLPQFKAEVDTVTVDVAVIDNKGHFIPGIPKGNFRILEDNVPQQISGYNMGEAPLTVALVIEFSNRFQRCTAPPGIRLCSLPWILQHPEAGRLRRGGGLRYQAGDPFGFHHGPQQDPGSLTG